MQHPTDRVVYIMAFVTLVVEHWMECKKFLNSNQLYIVVGRLLNFCLCYICIMYFNMVIIGH